MVVHVFEKFFVGLVHVLSSLFLHLSLPLVLFNRWNTRRASSPLLSHSLSRSIPRVQIKNRFPPTISALIGTVRRSKVRYIGAVKLILSKKECPRGSAPRADKATILRSSECTRLSQRVLPASVWIERAIYRGKSFRRFL